MGYEMTECPMCENYDAHSRTPDGMLQCALCNTSWGGAPSRDTAASWLPQPPPIH